jgi:hypothetical protein
VQEYCAVALRPPNAAHNGDSATTTRKRRIVEARAFIGYLPIAEQGNGGSGRSSCLPGRLVPATGLPEDLPVQPVVDLYMDMTWHLTGSLRSKVQGKLWTSIRGADSLMVRFSWSI